MTVSVSIFYQNSGFTPSKLYYSNRRCHFQMNSALPPKRLSYIWQKSKCIISKLRFNAVKSLLVTVIQ